MLEMVLGRKFKDWLKGVFTILLILKILNPFFYMHYDVNLFCTFIILLVLENPIFIDLYFFYTEMILTLGA